MVSVSYFLSNESLDICQKVETGNEFLLFGRETSREHFHWHVAQCFECFPRSR